ncbi:MAG: hypothetical protein ACRCZI_14900 [Cetobacterium sp.]
MAFFDFLNQPVGGYNTQSGESLATIPQDSMDAEFGGGGGFSTPETQMTWGQLLGAIARFSNTKGGQQLGLFMGNQFGSVGSGIPRQAGSTGMYSEPQIYKIGPTSDYNKPEQKDNTGIGEVMQIASAFGFL